MLGATKMSFVATWIHKEYCQCNWSCCGGYLSNRVDLGTKCVVIDTGVD